MRLIFEKVDGEFFFEAILTQTDLDQLQTLGGLIGTFAWEGDGIGLLNTYIRKEKEHDMPLVKGKKARSQEGFQENIKKEIEAGKPQKQSVAIAYSEARRSKKKAKKK